MKLLLEIHCRYPFAFHVGDISSLSTGAVLTPSAALDMLNVQSEREKAYEQFMEARLSETSTENFFDRLPKIKLQTFSSITQLKAVGDSGNKVILKADQNLFDCSDKTSEKVLQYSLGPVSQALAAGEGALRKTKKAALANETEKLAIATDCKTGPTACTMDEMAIIQKHEGNQTTFAELANILFRKFKHEASECGRADTVFDDYEEYNRDAE